MSRRCFAEQRRRAEHAARAAAGPLVPDEYDVAEGRVTVALRHFCQHRYRATFGLAVWHSTASCSGCALCDEDELETRSIRGIANVEQPETRRAE